ncbi:phosphatase PAP2 family protein [bacterium]|nr:phosphatase PAP2 family protein [bacterium]
MQSIDHHLTERLRQRGRHYLLFWKKIAAYGMCLFAIVWIGVSFAGWMPWWRPLIPFLLSYITLLVVQAIIKRERPNFEKISGYRMWVRTYSFPSGHATESAALAGALLFYPLYPSWEMMVVSGIFLSVVVGMVMYSRIAVGVHYVTDVIAGFCLGIVYVLAFL